MPTTTRLSLKPGAVPRPPEPPRGVLVGVLVKAAKPPEPVPPPPVEAPAPAKPKPRKPPPVRHDCETAAQLGRELQKLLGWFELPAVLTLDRVELLPVGVGAAVIAAASAHLHRPLTKAERRRISVMFWMLAQSRPYLAAMAQPGARRLDLDGQPGEPVSSDHRAAAIEALTGWHGSAPNRPE